MDCSGEIVEALAEVNAKDSVVAEMAGGGSNYSRGWSKWISKTSAGSQAQRCSMQALFSKNMPVRI